MKSKIPWLYIVFQRCGAYTLSGETRRARVEGTYHPDGKVVAALICGGLCAIALGAGILWQAGYAQRRATRANQTRKKMA